MKFIEVATQAELDAALKAKSDEIVVCTGGTWDKPLHVNGSATVRASGSATVEAYGSATVEAYDSATVRAYDSATVRAYGSATVRAYGSATVRASGSATVRASGSATVEASGSATVEAYGSATVEASKYVAIHKHPHGRQKINGGVVIELPPLDTAEAWLDYYGVPVTDGVVVLFKAVDDEYAANRGFKYEPGSTPEAPDWDSRPVCGGGLHFCARPVIARDKYHPAATRFVGCPVNVADIVVIDESKVKAPRVAAAVFEVDKHGDAIPVREDVAA